MASSEVNCPRKTISSADYAFIRFDADQLNGVRKKVLQMIFDLQSTNNLQQSLEFILKETSKANGRTEFCMYILAILILYLHALGKIQKDMVKNIIEVADRDDIKITLFVGMIAGTAIQSVAQELDPRISDLIGSFLKHLDQLTMNEVQILIKFLQEAIN